MGKSRRILAQETRWIAEPWECYQNLETSSPRVLLESARTGPGVGRYSILGSDPFLVFRYEKGKLCLTARGRQPKFFQTSDPITHLKDILQKYRLAPDPSLPPFAAGAIGYFAYECKNYMENGIKRKRSPESEVRSPENQNFKKKKIFQPFDSEHRILNSKTLRTASRFSVPEIYFLLFDRSVVWDHQRRCIHWCEWNGQALARPRLGLKEWQKKLLEKRNPSKGLEIKNFTPRMDLGFSMEEREFGAAVKRVKEYIRRGDIFQANLSHRISFKITESAKRLYARLRKVNPSSFFGILESGDFAIISGSPERLLRLEGRSLDTRPIAGTRARGSNSKQDRALSLDLFLSEKERAEHVMLVDLERNDLGRVSEVGSVRVDEFMSLENYSHVKHIVSNVSGTLREGLDAFDALRAIFPGGTITGAPKIRCMQIIDELETVSRGPYTGSLGYLSFSGDMDLNILIRSLVICNGTAWLNVGAGIVADSDPKKEYHETLHKAKAVLEAVFGQKSVRELYESRGIAARLS